MGLIRPLAPSVETNTNHFVVLAHRAGVAVTVALLALGGMICAQEAKSSAGAAASPGPKSSDSQDPPAPGDKPAEGADEPAKASAEQRAAEASRSAKSLQEMNLDPDLQEELLRGTRPGRKPPDYLTNRVKLIAEKPAPADLAKVAAEEFRKRPTYGDADKALLDKVVKYQVYSLTDPNLSTTELRKNATEVGRMLDNLPSSSSEFQSLYRETAVQYLRELLTNHLFYRINAMILLAKVKDERLISDLFVPLIEDPEQPEGVKLWAVKAIGALGPQHVKVDLETKAVGALLSLLNHNNPVHPFTRAQIVQSLGAIGRVSHITIQKDAAVAVQLLQVVRNPSLRRADRSLAVVALGELQIPPDLDYNFQLVAYEIGQFIAEAVAAAMQDPAADNLETHFFLVDASYVLDGGNPKLTALSERAKQHPKGQGRDAAYVSDVGKPIKAMRTRALQIYSKGGAKPPTKDKAKDEDVMSRVTQIRKDLNGTDMPAQLEAFNEWLRRHPPRSMQLTPDVPELGPPPVLTRPRAPTEKKLPVSKKPVPAAAGESIGP